MKKRIILTLAASALLLSACYEDLSTPATGEYSPIKIELNMDSDTLTVGYGETLSIVAKAEQEGYTADDFTFSWEMDITPGKVSGRTVVCEEPALEYLVLNTPSSTPYNLTLTVKNKVDGYSQILNWPVFVVSTLGDGLLVAHTRDHGETSQLCLTCATPITYGYTASEPKSTDRLYELANNGESIKGRVTGLLARATSYIEQPNAKSYGTERLMITTDKEEIIMVDPNSYSFVAKNDELITGKHNFSKYESKVIGNVSAVSSYISIDGYLYGCMEILDHSYSPVAYGGSKTGVFTEKNTCGPLINQGFITCFDPITKRFYYCNGVFLTQGSMALAEGSVVPDPAWLDDKEAVACGALKSLMICYILKNPSNEYFLVEIQPNDNKDAKIIPLDLPDVDKAIGWAFCDNCEVIYYYTPEKIYSIIANGSTATTKALSWKPDSSNEKISIVKQYTQGWYGTGNISVDSKPSDLYYYQFLISTNRTQIIVVTYNETTGEGKFYLKPFNVSTGMFSAFKDNGTYGGFGEITAICGTRR